MREDVRVPSMAWMNSQVLWGGGGEEKLGTVGVPYLPFSLKDDPGTDGIQALVNHAQKA